jgi:NAD(P)-dependent dehydrogenase (short-subunit alcohol dehydrogenase family)
MPAVQDVTSNTKIAIITGGSRGLGRDSVLSLAKRGVHAIFTYNSNRAEAEEVVGLLGKTGQKDVAFELDAGNVGTFDNFVEKVRQALGSLGAVRFDYLVNTAGISHHNSIEKTTPRFVRLQTIPKYRAIPSSNCFPFSRQA